MSELSPSQCSPEVQERIDAYREKQKYMKYIPESCAALAVELKDLDRVMQLLHENKYTTTHVDFVYRVKS